MKLNERVIAALAITSILAFHSGCKKESVTEPTKDPEQPSIQMVQVAGGMFQMGSSTGLSDQKPVHSVTVGTYYIDNTEITYEKWAEVRNWGLSNGYSDLPEGRNGYNPVGTSNPVTEVNWYEVVKWCNARSEKDGLTPMYYESNTLAFVYRTGQLYVFADAVKWTANGYRLPTEAEWEFAARGGTKTRGYTYSGSNTIEDVAWSTSNSLLKTHPVATKGANELGIYDMSGNVWEMTNDWYEDYYYSGSPRNNPTGPGSGVDRVVRGGCRTGGALNQRTSRRVYIYDRTGSDRGGNVGFRLLRTP